jgi:hypothetical protein
MRRIQVLILAFVAASVLLAGCTAARLALPTVPSVPVTVADSEVRGKLLKVVGVLDAMGDVTADLARVERRLYADGAIPTAAHTAIRARISAFSRAGLAALDRIDQGVERWSDIRPLLDSLIAELNGLVALINASSGSVRSALGSFAESLVNGFGSALFGGSR